MADQERAIQFGKRGLDLWGKGQLLEAADCFREAISLTEPGHYLLWNYHGSLGRYFQPLIETTRPSRSSLRHWRLTLNFTEMTLQPQLQCHATS